MPLNANYTVKLTAFSKNGKKKDENSLTININQPPTKCWIKKVTFTDYPEYENGYYWDNAVAGNYPDIYFVIANQNATTVYFDPGTSSKIENVQSAPFYWQWQDNGLEIDLNQIIYFHIYDYESLSSNTWMAGCGGFKLSDYKVYPYPSQINIACDNISYTLDVTWGN